MMRWAEACQGAAYLAVVGAVEEGCATRARCTIGCLRVVVRIAAVRETGVSVSVSDLVRAGLGSGIAIRANVAEAVRVGLVGRSGVGGASLDVTTSGRALVREALRAWARAARQLGAFEAVGPYVRP